MYLLDKINRGSDFSLVPFCRISFYYYVKWTTEFPLNVKFYRAVGLGMCSYSKILAVSKHMDNIKSLRAQ